MENEVKIIGMLEKIIEKQDEHSRILAEHTKMHEQHTATLNEHSRILAEHSKKHEQHTATLNEHTKMHEQHTTQFEEHGQILSALRTGQEYLKAQIDEMKITNAREFGSVKEQLSQVSVNQDLLREDVWQNKVDTHRIKNTLGMK